MANVQMSSILQFHQFRPLLLRHGVHPHFLSIPNKKKKKKFHANRFYPGIVTFWNRLLRGYFPECINYMFNSNINRYPTFFSLRLSLVSEFIHHNYFNSNRVLCEHAYINLRRSKFIHEQWNLIQVHSGITPLKIELKCNCFQKLSCVSPHFIIRIFDSWF